jgi:hypothetical protein
MKPFVLAAGVILAIAHADTIDRARLNAIQAEVSSAEIEQTLRAIDIDRTSAGEGERRAAAFLDRKLTEYGVAHTTYDARLFLSWPGRAELTSPGQPAIVGKTAAFAAPTPQGGLSGALLIDPALTRHVDRSLSFGPEVRGRIPVVHDIADTEALVLAGQQARALAVVQIDATDTLHEDIVTTIWGTPTSESAARLPVIPFLSITKSDGERLKALAKGAGTATLVTEATRGWRTVPIVVADVPGRARDFVFVTTHLDAWYNGMTDTAGSVASILDIARTLQKHRAELVRGVRFAWWPGHSFGRYAGSAWYADRFWGDLDANCVAYTNLDGPGRRGSQMNAVAASGWPGLAEYARQFATELTGKPVPPGRGDRLFRPGRDSDSSYQGLGIPFFSIGVPGPSRGHPDVDVAGRIRYWHTKEDTFDKLDLDALKLDTAYRAAQIYDLATTPALPHRFGPIAAAYVEALQDLTKAAGGTFDLTPVNNAAAAFGAAADRFDRRPRPSDPAGVARFNGLIVRLTHRLYSTLYTKGGRFDQDPAAEMPILPLLARVKDLPSLARDGNEFGFVETEMIRGRNAVEAALREATGELDAYLSTK